MKLALCSVALVLTLVVIGIACGPEQTYCEDKHKTCEQARQDEIARQMNENAMRADMQTTTNDGGTTVIEAGSTE